MKFFKSNFAKKLIIVLVVLMVFNIAIPKKVHAWDFAGIIYKPILTLYLSFLTSVDVQIGIIMFGVDMSTGGVGTIVEKITKEGAKLDTTTTLGDEDNKTGAEGENEFDAQWGSVLISKLFIGPDTIISGEVSTLNANIFEANTETISFSKNNASAIPASVDGVASDIVYGSNLSGTLKKGVASTYVVLRNICAMIMLAGLIFTGIRVLVTSNTPNKAAQWRQLIFDWLVGMALLIFSHVIMYGIFWVSDALTTVLKDSMMGFGGLNFTLIKQCLTSLDSAEQIICLVMLTYLIYLTLVFIISYFKRLLWVCVLIVIAPIVSIMYAFGNQTKQIYSKWLREYMMTVLVQPFQMIVYYVTVSIPLNMVGHTDGEYTGLNTFTILYALGAITMIRPTWNYVEKLFGFDQGLAKMASPETGRKTLNAGIEMAKEVGAIAIKAAAPEVAPLVNAAQKMDKMKDKNKEESINELAPPSSEEETEETNPYIGEMNQDNLLADDPGMYNGFSRDPFHEDYYSGDEFFDNDLQNEPPSGMNKLSEEEMQEELDNLGLERGSEERAEMEESYRAAGHGDPKYNDSANDELEDTSDSVEKVSATSNSGAEAYAFNNKMSESELQDELDRLGLDKGSEERAEMEENLRAAGHGDNVGEIGDNIYDEELENYTPASNGEVKYNDGDTRMDELLEDISDSDENNSSDDEKNIKANTVKIEAGNVDMQKNDSKKDLENNVVSDNIKTADVEDTDQNEETENHDETSNDINNEEINTNGEPAENIKDNNNVGDEKNINASSVTINAGNVNMQGDITQGTANDEVKTIDEQNKDTENNENSDENESDEDEEKKKKENEGKIEIENEGTPTREKDRFLKRRSKEFNAFIDFSRGESGITDTAKKLSPDSLFGKVTQQALDTDIGKKFSKFEDLGGTKALHKGFNEIRDTFFADAAPGDWKPTNEKMGEKIKEKNEQKEFNFVNDEGNKEYMFNIIYQKDREKLRKEHPDKSEAWIQGKCREKAESKLESLSKIYVPLGIENVQVAYECEEDRKKYGWSASEAVEQRINYEKFNHNIINVEQANKYLETNNSTIQESIPEARDYYNNGYTSGHEIARASELTSILGITTEYGMKLDKALKNKGSKVNLNLEKRNDLTDEQKERLGKIIDTYSSDKE